MAESGTVKKTKKKTSSQSRTKSANGLTSTDICEIIKTARQCGVKRLNFEGLDLSFEDKPNVALQNPIVINENLDDNESDEKMEVETLDLDELAINDPVTYEKIVHGELNV